MTLNTAETFELLFDRNNSVAYKALQELQKESEETDCVYPYMDRLSDMLDSDNSYIRTEKATFGDAYIDSIVKEIQDAFPGIKGFNRRGLYRMKQFYGFTWD